MARKSFVLLVTGIVIFFLCSISSADVPHMINYQGKLTTATGGCLNDTVSMTFTIYSDSLGTSDEWSETQDEVVVKEGIFSVLLGSVDSIPSAVFDGNVKYLGVQVESDPEMRPLKPMVSVAYAFNSATAAPDADWTISGDDIYRLDGNVGVGTETPAAKLHVTGGELQINTDQVGGYYSRIDGNEISGGTAGGPPGSHHLHVKPGDNSSNLLLAEDGGNVGIGTTSPSWPLQVASSRWHTGYFTSDCDSTWGTHVIHSEFTGSGDYDAIAVYGSSHPADGYGIGGAFGGGSMGVQGAVGAEGTVITDVYMGVFGSVSGGSGSNWGVVGSASGSGSNIGVYGVADSATANYAGVFYGNVKVYGTLSKGGGSFIIDHPLDPENKYLYHSFVESPDMMNVYNGNVLLDANGEAVIQLPDYFEALNRDFRYQLTCIGGFAPVYISQKISGNQFTIAGGQPGMEVSWQVTGIRHDKFAEGNRIQVEVDKTADERGKYLHPRAYGLSEAYGIPYEQHKRMEEKRQAADH